MDVLKREQKPLRKDRWAGRIFFYRTNRDYRARYTKPSLKTLREERRIKNKAARKSRKRNR